MTPATRILGAEMAVGIYDSKNKYLGYIEPDIISRVQAPYVQAYAPREARPLSQAYDDPKVVTDMTLDIVGFERVRTHSGRCAYRFVTGSLEALKRLPELHYAGEWPKLGSFLNEAEGRD